MTIGSYTASVIQMSIEEFEKGNAKLVSEGKKPVPACHTTPALNHLVEYEVNKAIDKEKLKAELKSKIHGIL